MQRSSLNANCRHSSVTCERIDVSNSATPHPESKFGTAGVAVRLQINKESNLCRIPFNIICVRSTFGVFRSPWNPFNLLSSLSTSSNRPVTCYWAICELWILKPDLFMQDVKTCVLILLTLYFLHNQNISMSRFDKRKDYIINLECQLALFIKT